MKTKTLMLILLVTVFSCNKDKTENRINPINNPVGFNSLNENLTPFPIKIRVGTYLWPNCEGKNPCGPCAGICIRITRRLTEDYILSEQEFNEGDRVCNFLPISDEAAQIILNYNDSDLVHNDSIYFSGDIEFPDSDAVYCGFNEMKIKQGAYKVLNNGNNTGTSIISLNTN